MRTTPNISNLLCPLEEAIQHKLIPTITGRSAITDAERKLLALPCRLGGLGLIDPTNASTIQYRASEKITKPLVAIILEQKQAFPFETWTEMKRMQSSTKKEKRQKLDEEAAALELSEPLKRSLELASEKGASLWLTALPLERHGFALHKSAFRDAISLRYSWLPDHLPSKCACGATFTVDHAMCCPKGAFPTLRHNELRDITGSLLSKVCPEVSIEPGLQPLDGHELRHATANKEDNARADIQARGFWGIRHQRAFLMLRYLTRTHPLEQEIPSFLMLPSP